MQKQISEMIKVVSPFSGFEAVSYLPLKELKNKLHELNKGAKFYHIQHLSKTELMNYLMDSRRKTISKCIDDLESKFSLSFDTKNIVAVFSPSIISCDPDDFELDSYNKDSEHVCAPLFYQVCEDVFCNEVGFDFIEKLADID